MAYSFGLTLYHLASRREASLPVDRPARPEGRLVWLHAPQADAACGMVQLARQLRKEGGLQVLVTCREALEPLAGVILQPPPADSQAAVVGFLDHWKPDIALMSGGELRPALLHEAVQRRIPLIMVDAGAPHILADRDGWYPGLVRSCIGCFSQVLAVDETAARAWRKAGGTADQLRVTGRMEQGSAALPCTEAERAALSRLLGTRPVWLTADLPQAEETAVIEAHRATLRLSHRLLLILVPQDPARAADLTRRMEDGEGWQVARRAVDQEPDAETEVYIADVPAEYGLWYRLAPVTYLGGSLSASGCLRDPLEAAALGSAIVHGPRFGRFGGIFQRLATVRATRPVASAADLAAALAELLSPDRAARLAQAAWGVASEGVEVTDRVLSHIRKMLSEAK